MAIKKGRAFQQLRREWAKGRVKTTTMLVALSEQLLEIGDVLEELPTGLDEAYSKPGKRGVSAVDREFGAVRDAAEIVRTVASVVDTHAISHAGDEFTVTKTEARQLERIAAGRSRRRRRNRVA